MTGAVSIRLDHAADVEGWRRAACRLDQAGVPPERVIWSVAGEPADLFGGGGPMPGPKAAQPRRDLPRALSALTERLLLHRDRERFALGYRLLWRSRAQPQLLQVASDRDVARAGAMAKAVGRDMHKMKAFVRFRSVRAPDGQETFVAWFEPDHHIVAATAPFFMRRFASMRWSILTPERSAHWDGDTLTLGEGAAKADAPDGDRLEEIWRTYFASIFNPARLKVKAMTAEMPKKYWRNLPEAPLIRPLIRGAEARAQAMVVAPATLPRRQSPVPCAGAPHAGVGASIDSLDALARAEAACMRCPLHRTATQAVPGEGPQQADLMVVGEQPGDQEDLAGRPFVGPAGKLFDAALERVGIDRKRAFVTNAVKHFKFEPRGKRRLHKRPNVSEIEHCRWWLEIERRLVRPKLIVCMGATAARGVIGRAVTIAGVRGKVLPLEDGAHGLVTVHPSYLLRIDQEERKRAEWRSFLADLCVARDWIANHAASDHPSPRRQEGSRTAG